jgi:hypothetical protein
LPSNNLFLSQYFAVHTFLFLSLQLWRFHIYLLSQFLRKYWNIQGHHLEISDLGLFRCHWDVLKKGSSKRMIEFRKFKECIAYWSSYLKCLNELNSGLLLYPQETTLDLFKTSNFIE